MTFACHTLIHTYMHAQVSYRDADTESDSIEEEDEPSTPTTIENMAIESTSPDRATKSTAAATKKKDPFPDDIIILDSESDEDKKKPVPRFQASLRFPAKDRGVRWERHRKLPQAETLSDDHESSGSDVVCLD
jgi:hypothetical protein